MTRSRAPPGANKPPTGWGFVFQTGPESEREEASVYVVLDPARVGAMRQERGMSRRALAARAGVGMSTVAKVEAGEVAVRLSTARGIGAALGVDPKSLGRSL